MQLSRKSIIALIFLVTVGVSAFAVEPPVSTAPWAFESMAPQLLGLMRSSANSRPQESDSQSSASPQNIDGLNPLQAQHLLTALLPWQKNPYLTPAEAKTVWDQVQAILTPEQRNWKPGPGLGGPPGATRNNGNANPNFRSGNSEIGASSGSTGTRGNTGRNTINGASQNFEIRHLNLIRLTIAGLSRLAGISSSVEGESGDQVDSANDTGRKTRKPNGDFDSGREAAQSGGDTFVAPEPPQGDGPPPD